MRRRLAVSLLTTVAALVVTSTAGATPNAPRSFSPGPASTSLRQLVGALGGRPSNAAGLGYAYLRKLDSHLQDLVAAKLDGRSTAGAAAREGLTLTSAGGVRADVYVDGDLATATAALRALGMRVEAVSDQAPERMVEGVLPVAKLTAAAALGSTHAVLSVFTGTNTGGTLSQGDAAHHGPQARALGPTGAGVPVGVISDSIDQVGGGISDSQGTGDLPGPASSPAGQVTTLNDSPGGEDEGRAMAEIMFDEAPGIRNIFFSTGTLGAATKAQSINNLVAQGVKVIADDTFDPTEPDFQDGIVAQAVDAAKAAGVAYFVSAGNRARQSWEGTYAPIGGTNNFGGGDTVQTIGTFSNVQMFIALQWDEPFGGATTDLALDVYSDGSKIGTVNTDNIATGIPEEIAGVSIGATSHTVGIAIRRVAGARNPFMKYIVGGTPTFTIAEHNTNSDAIDPDAASSNGALTVAASHYPTPATPEDFSSRGPVTHLFDSAGTRLASPDVRQKPQVSGADGVSTSVPVTGLSTFFGTSAAAPAIAGIATLLRSANPGMPVDEVYAILTNPANTTDCTATAGVPDLDCGFGFDLADGEMQQALDTTPPSISPAVNPASPNGAHGWYTSPVSVTWNLADSGSPVVDPNGCGPTPVTSEGAIALTCKATSAGGTASNSITVKHDASPPTTPTFSGIAAKHYAPGKVPGAGSIHCSASDPGSGVDGCVVSGRKTTAGRHTLSGIATNDAGLTTTGKLTYNVNAIGGLTLPKRFSVGSLFSSGLPIGVVVGSGKTTVAAKLTGSVSGAARTLVLGSVKKTFTKPGKAKLRLRLNGAGRRAFTSGKLASIKLTVTGKSGGASTTLKKKFKLKH